MRKKIFYALFLTTFSMSAICSAGLKSVTIDWAMTDTTGVQSYKMYYSYHSDMADRVLLQDCEPWQETSLNNFTLTCNNVNITAYPIYFSVAAVTPEGEMDSPTEVVLANVSIVQNFTLLTPSVNTPPVAVISTNTTGGTAPLTVNFDGRQSSDTDGTISSYSWKFDNTNSATGSTASFTFTNSGSFPVTLTVTDDKGSKAQTQTTIAVTEIQTATNFAINYQPTTAPFPAGFLVDSGTAFNTTTNYGWTVADAYGVADRNSTYSPSQEYDTVILAKPTAVWEHAVTNGQYRVTVVVGDPVYYSGKQYVQIENLPVIAGESLSSLQKWIEKTVDITVTDGRLTFAFAGDSLTKLCWIKALKIN